MLFLSPLSPLTPHSLPRPQFSGCSFITYSNMTPRLPLLETWRDFFDCPQDLYFLPGGRLLNLDLDVVAEKDLDSEDDGELSQERDGDLERLKRDRA